MEAFIPCEKGCLLDCLDWVPYQGACIDACFVWWRDTLLSASRYKALYCGGIVVSINVNVLTLKNDNDVLPMT